MRNLLIILFFFAFVTANADVQPPSFRCIQLDEDDNVTLFWTIPSDPNNEFLFYRVYYRDNGSPGPFSILTDQPNYAVDSIYAQGSFSGNGRFFIRSFFDDGSGLDSSITSDTISPMLITGVSNGQWVTVNWNQLSVESPDSSYRVFRRKKPEPWLQIAQTGFDSTTVYDTIQACNDTFQYKVEIDGLGGCISQSNIGLTNVTDDVLPATTDLICASVDTSTGHVFLEWEASKSADVFGYQLYYITDFTWPDTTFNLDTLTFVFTKRGIDAMSRPETLSVAPFDSCLKGNWYNQAASGLEFSTLFVELVDVDRCAGEAVLKWNLPSENHPVGIRNVSEYRVYARTPGGSSELRGTLSTLDSVFVDTGLVLGQTYTYVVTAYSETFDKEAMSNAIEASLAAPDLADVFYLSCVSTERETGINRVELEVDPNSDLIDYGLLRAYDRNGPYQLVNRIEVENDESVTLIDNSDIGNQTSVFYQVVGFDECDEIVQRTDTARSIHLDGSLNDEDLSVSLNWNAFEGFDSNATAVGAYELVRITNENDRSYIYTSQEPDSYIDDIEPIENVGGNICYVVDAVESETNSFGLLETCNSNVLCFPQEPRVFIPNSFSPDGDQINDQFLPYINYVDLLQYDMQIFDRAGALVFQSNDPLEPWSGEGFGIGVYVYHIEIVNVRGESEVFRGRIHLFR